MAFRTCDDIIDLDEEYTVHDWKESVNKRLEKTVEVDSERNLDALMKWYLQTLKENFSLKNLELWKIWIIKHLKFFKSYLMELNCLYLDNYLLNMENILVHYFDIELKCLSIQQSNGKGVTKRIISKMYGRVVNILYSYLLGKEDHVLHVLLKIKYEFSRETFAFMNLIYTNILTKTPSNRSDLAFCRAYLLFEKWKKLLSMRSECKNDIDMEIFFYRLYRRRPENVKENPFLRKILQPDKSILSVLASSQDGNDNLIDRYFDLISSGNIQEGEVLADSWDNNTVQFVEDEVLNLDDDDEEDEEFQKAYNSYQRSMNNATVVDTIEIPDDDESNEDDCKIVEEVVLFCDISDDEPDVIFVSTESETSSKKTTEEVSSKETTKDLPSKENTKGVPSKEITKCVTSKETTIEVPSKETTKGVPSKETTKGVPSMETTKGVPSMETRNDIPPKETTKGVLSQETTMGVLSKETTKRVPSKESTEDVPLNETTKGVPSTETTKGVASKETREDLPSKEPIKDVSSKVNNVPQVIIEDHSDPLEDTKTEKLDSIAQEPTDTLVDSSVNVTYKLVAAIKDSPIVQDYVMKENSNSTVVASPTEKPPKKCVTIETQTEYIDQIGGLLTPSGSEERNNEDLMAFAINKSSDSDSDNSKNDIRSPSPIIPQFDNSNKECPIQQTQSISDRLQNGKEDAQVSTSDQSMSAEEKSDSENNIIAEKDMSPDSSEDVTKSSELEVKREKIMYTCPQKLKKMKDIPDCASFMNDSTAFIGQVDGRLNPSSADKYHAITETFNLYETSDDLLSDNIVSSSNYLPEISENIDIVSKNKAKTTIPSKVKKQGGKRSISHKKKLVVSEEVTTSDESKPHFPVNVPNVIPKGILKTELYVRLEKNSIEALRDLESVNKISSGVADKPFPQFEFKVCDFRSEKEKRGPENTSVSSNYASNAGEHSDEGLNSNEIPITDKKGGKRKRQNNFNPGLRSNHSSDYRETYDKEAVETTNRGRKKLKKVSFAVVRNRRSRKYSPVY